MFASVRVSCGRLEAKKTNAQIRLAHLAAVAHTIHTYFDN
jgi:hypothetical protein